MLPKIQTYCYQEQDGNALNLQIKLPCIHTQNYMPNAFQNTWKSIKTTQW